MLPTCEMLRNIVKSNKSLRMLQKDVVAVEAGRFEADLLIHCFTIPAQGKIDH